MTLEEIVAALQREVGPQITEINTRLAVLTAINTRLDAFEEGQTARQTAFDAAVQELRERIARKDIVVGDGVRVDTKGRIVPTVSRGCAEWITKAVRAGVPGFANEMREMGAASGAVGGYLVPAEFMTEFLMLVDTYGRARQLFRKIPMTTAGPLTMPALDGEMTTFWIDENEAPTESAPTFKQFTISNKILGVLTHVPLSLVKDSNPAVMQIVVESIARAFAKEEDRVGFKGNTAATPTADKFNGLLYATGANSLVLAAGKTAFSDITADDLLDAINATPEGALDGAGFILHRTNLAHVQKLKDSTGSYIYRRPEGNEPATIWDYPILKIESMPNAAATAAATPFIAFCNPQYMAIGDRQELEIAQDASAGFTKAQIYVRGLERIGFAPTLPTGITIIKTATS